MIAESSRVDSRRGGAVYFAIGILFFLAWLAGYYFHYIGHVFTYVFLFIAIVLIVIHFVLMYRRRGRGRGEI